MRARVPHPAAREGQAGPHGVAQRPVAPVKPGLSGQAAHARFRLRQRLRHKHKVPGRGHARFPDEYLHEALGLLQLEPLAAARPWAKA